MGNLISNIIIILIVACIVIGISVYIYKSKKKGKKCIGCPNCSQCNGKYK